MADSRGLTFPGRVGRDYVGKDGQEGRQGYEGGGDLGGTLHPSKHPEGPLLEPGEEAYPYSHGGVHEVTLMRGSMNRVANIY